MLLVPLQGKKAITGTFLGYFPKGLHFYLFAAAITDKFCICITCQFQAGMFQQLCPHYKSSPQICWLPFIPPPSPEPVQLQHSFIHISVPTCGEGDATSLRFIYKLQVTTCVNLASCTQQKGAFQNRPAGTTNQTALAQFP